MFGDVDWEVAIPVGNKKWCNTFFWQIVPSFVFINFL